MSVCKFEYVYVTGCLYVYTCVCVPSVSAIGVCVCVCVCVCICVCGCLGAFHCVNKFQFIDLYVYFLVLRPCEFYCAY